MKCVHIFVLPKVRHNDSIVDVISELQLDDEMKNIRQDVVVFDKDIYQEFKEKCNCFFSEFDVVTTINKQAEMYDWCFLHCLQLNSLQILRINKKALNKMIWVVWGHDLYLTKEDEKIGQKIIKILRKIKWFIPDLRLRNLFAIGIGWDYDKFEIRKRFGQIKIMKCPYGYKKRKKNIIDSTFELQKSNIDTYSLPIKVMIGHSAYPMLKHIEIMEKLKKYRNENILLSLVLSYGDMDYQKKVISYAETNWKGKVEIITDYFEYTDYLKYIDSVDIAIFANKHQSALSNITFLNYRAKKLFLNRNGILKKAMDMEHIDNWCIDEIDDMSFDEFIEPICNTENSFLYGKKRIDENFALSMWKNSLKDLEKNEKNNIK